MVLRTGRCRPCHLPTGSVSQVRPNGLSLERSAKSSSGNPGHCAARAGRATAVDNVGLVGLTRELPFSKLCVTEWGNFRVLIIRSVSLSCQTSCNTKPMIFVRISAYRCGSEVTCGLSATPPRRKSTLVSASPAPHSTAVANAQPPCLIGQRDVGAVRAGIPLEILGFLVCARIVVIRRSAAQSAGRCSPRPAHALRASPANLCLPAGYFPRSPRMYGSPRAAGAPIRLRVASREPITSTMIVKAYGIICKKKPQYGL